MADTCHYETMSLDDVIRDMKAKKALENTLDEGNSPFLRQPYRRFPRRYAKPLGFQPKSFVNDRSNYINHMAKKRLNHAMDLRRKLIHKRVTNQRLDLRWKLVANYVAANRKRNRMLGADRFHPYARPYLNETRSSGYGGMGPPHHFVRSRVPSSIYLSQMERLVGKLPPWMARPSMPGDPVAGPRPSFKPMRQAAPRTCPTSNTHSDGVCQFGHPVTVHSHPHVAHVHSNCSVVSCNAGGCQQQVPCAVPQNGNADRPMPPLAFEPPRPVRATMPSSVPQNCNGERQMPPLAYEPPFPVHPTAPANAGFASYPRAPRYGGMVGNLNDDEIEIVVQNNDEDPRRVVKPKTLNERFTV